MSTATRTVNLVKTACNWCDLPATFEVCEEGWRDFACVQHAQRYFSVTFNPAEVGDA